MAIALFNLYGYQLFIAYLQNKQESTFEAKLDIHSYQDAELTIIKLPLNLPYYSNSKEFERINGSVEINGIQYKYVKRRVYNDTIELACLPNLSTKEFENLKFDFVKLSSEGQNTHQQKRSPNIKIAYLDYCEKIYCFSLPAISANGQGIAPYYFLDASSSYLPVQELPPDYPIA